MHFAYEVLSLIGHRSDISMIVQQLYIWCWYLSFLSEMGFPPRTPTPDPPPQWVNSPDACEYNISWCYGIPVFLIVNSVLYQDKLLKKCVKLNASDVCHGTLVNNRGGGPAAPSS